jgi:hypothetical protein
VSRCVHQRATQHNALTNPQSLNPPPQAVLAYHEPDGGNLRGSHGKKLGSIDLEDASLALIPKSWAQVSDVEPCPTCLPLSLAYLCPPFPFSLHADSRDGLAVQRDDENGTQPHTGRTHVSCFSNTVVIVKATVTQACFVVLQRGRDE